MPITVFLADDHAVVRDGLLALFQIHRDLRVVGTASNGREALQQIRALRPDIVLMDISMPELNGIEAARQVLSTAPKTRIIILSMYGASEHIVRALRAGARGYLLKETAGAEVIDAIRAVHAGRRYVSQRIAPHFLDDLIHNELLSSDPLDKLSAREREILQLLAEGKSIAAIAKILSLSPKTIETYKSRLMTKLGIGDMAGLVKFAIQHGLTQV